MQLFPGLSKQLPAFKVEVEPGLCALQMFSEAGYEDDCSDANLREVVYYLRGCTGLQIPASWRPLLPEYL